jgi:hypothetical protein
VIVDGSPEKRLAASFWFFHAFRLSVLGFEEYLRVAYDHDRQLRKPRGDRPIEAVKTVMQLVAKRP